MPRRTGWMLLIIANILFCGVLSFYRTTDAAQTTRRNPPPFANSVQQRLDMNNTLNEIKELLAEQNALLRSGKLTVIVSESENR
jgi:hypothetical protein